MSNGTVSLSDDISRAREESSLHFWSGISMALVSFILPIVGLIAIYSGYQLTDVMKRSWFGGILAVFGLVNFILWIVALAFLM